VLANDRRRLAESLDDLERRLKAFHESFAAARSALSEATRQETADRLVALLVDLSNIAGEASLIQARARVEAITVDPITLDSAVALEIARANRLDWMNNRAALVDTWRLIEFNANALKSDFTITLNGSLQTAGNDNPFDFRGERGTLSAGVQYDPPFTRLLERNNFRQQLIVYQQNRRNLIQFEDGVSRNLRQLIRDAQQLYTNLEIQRRAMAIAIRRVDQTREVLNKPAAMAAPGVAPAQLGPTSTLNLLTALSDLRNTQNNFISVWINYYAARMRLLREMGLMQIDANGMWIEESIDEAVRRCPPSELLPPDVPPGWMPDDGTPPPPAPATSPPVIPPPAPAATDAAFHPSTDSGRVVLIPDAP
jgi:hypothetical protein